MGSIDLYVDSFYEVDGHALAVFLLTITFKLLDLFLVKNLLPPGGVFGP